MDPRVTILLPTHNRADVLGWAIRSVLWQTEGDFELLIVGDGCTDNTADVVAGFSDPRIRWLDLPKAPFSGYANRNIALRQARGRTIAYAQHDDILFPDHVEKLVAALDAAAADWAYSRPLWVTPNGDLLPFAVNLTSTDERKRFLNQASHIPSCCVVHTRSALERVGYWPEDMPRYADWVCWRRILTSGIGAVGFCPQPTALHFRAIWKTDEIPPEQKLREIAAANWWPQECRVSVPSGMPEQQALFEAMEADPAGWAEEVRAGVGRIVDRLAWSWLVPNLQTWPHDDPVSRGLRDRHRKLEEAHSLLRQEQVRLKRDVARLEGAVRHLRAAEKQHHVLEKRWVSRTALMRQLFTVLLRKARGVKASPRTPPRRLPDP